MTPNMMLRRSARLIFACDNAQIMSVQAQISCAYPLQTPKRQYTIEELRLHKIEPSTLLSPQDKSLERIRTYGQVVCGAIVRG